MSRHSKTLDLELDAGKVIKVGGTTQTIGAQQSAISDVGGSPADAVENAVAINAILAALRAYGIIASS